MMVSAAEVWAFSSGEVVYFSSMVTMVLGTVALYWSHGALVITRVVAYLLSLSTMTLTVKNLYVTHNYDFPKFVTMTHFVSAGLLAGSILAYRRVTGQRRVPVPPLCQFFAMIFPMSLFFAFSIAGNNLALVYVTAGFSEMINGGSPLMVVVCMIALGKNFDLRLLGPVVVVFSGIALCATGERHFSLLGFTVLLLSVFARAFKATLQQILMEPTSKEGHVSFDPIEMLAWTSLPSSIVMLAWSLLTEGMDPYTALAGKEHLSALIWAIAFTCVNACILNVANLLVIKDLGAVGAQLTGQLKGVLIVLGGIVLLGETLAPMQVIGFSGVLTGVYWYNHVEAKIRAAAKGAKTLETTPLVWSSSETPSSLPLKKGNDTIFGV